MQFDYRDFLLKIPCNTRIPIMEDWDFFLISGTFSGPSHPDNRGLVVIPRNTITPIIKDWELFLDLFIPIIKDLLYIQLFIFFL